MMCIDFYFSADGTRHPNTLRRAMPFDLMTKPGDWFSVPTREYHNDPQGLANRCWYHGRRLGRTFEMRTILFNGERNYRITFIEGEKPPTLNRIETFTGHDGTVHKNDLTDANGAPSRYPFELMDVGDWFEVVGNRRESQAALKALTKAEFRSSAKFTLEMIPNGYPRVIRLE